MAQDREFNDHIDYCLSRQTIKEAATAAAAMPVEQTYGVGGGGHENGRLKRKASAGRSTDARKKLFFGK